jgi:hypothetical protein
MVRDKGLQSQAREYPRFEPFHALRLIGALVIMSLQVQRAVNRQVSVMGIAAYAAPLRLACHHRRADRDISLERARRIDKGQHVGRVSTSAVMMIKQARFARADNAQREPRAFRDCGAPPFCEVGA